MTDGKDVWNQWFQQDMEMVHIGGREFYSFPSMKENVYEMLAGTAEKYPDKEGLYDNWNRGYTYSGFLGITDKLAAYLKYTRNVKKGDRIGLLLHNGIEFASAYFALSKLGAVVVPLPTKYREPEIRSLIKKADLSGILVSADYAGWVEDCESRGIFVLTEAGEEDGYGFSWIFETEEWSLVPPEAAAEGSEGRREDEFILMFTSGTTSESKGVILKNYNIGHAVMIYQRLLGLTEKDRTVIPVPIYHITGLSALLTLFVFIGGTVFLYRRYDAERILRGILEQQITFLHGSPTVFGMFLEYQKKYPELPSVRKLACGSSYMPVDTMQKLHDWMPGMQFQNVYGMTETSSPATIFPYDAATSIYSGSQGLPIPGMQIRITDDSQNELAVGEAGNVWLRGANICEYYYHMKSDLITEDGWLDTGDIGYINEDAYVFIVDRKKDMINRGGEKIWCTDVEDELMRLAGIKDAAVVGIPDKTYGEVAAAVVVAEDGCSISEDQIKEGLKSRLARYKIPAKILFVSAVPKTPGLKTDKRKIRQMFEEEELIS